MIAILFLSFTVATLPLVVSRFGSTIHIHQILPQISIVILFTIALIANHVSFHLFAKSLIVIGSNVALCLQAAFYGRSAGIEIFYFVLFFFPLILFNRRQKFLIFSGMFLSVFLYMSLYLFPSFWKYFETITFPEKDRFLWTVLNGSLAFLVAGLIVYSFFNATEEAEANLELERVHSDQLLLNILPKPIADRLKAGEKIIVDNFDSVSVIFTDLTGFTQFTSSVAPSYLIQELNDLFSAFDDIAKEYGVEKIKTIGDSYMAVSGIPETLEPPVHARQALLMAIEMQKKMNDWKKGDKEKLSLRIGIHSGPVIAGVIGKNKFVYDLWGDTVNIANRLETNCLPGKIQVSSQTKEILAESFRFQARDGIELKGLGKTTTYLFEQVV